MSEEQPVQYSGEEPVLDQGEQSDQLPVNQEGNDFEQLNEPLQLDAAEQSDLMNSPEVEGFLGEADMEGNEAAEVAAGMPDPDSEAYNPVSPTQQDQALEDIAGPVAEVDMNATTSYDEFPASADMDQNQEAANIEQGHVEGDTPASLADDAVNSAFPELQGNEQAEPVQTVGEASDAAADSMEGAGSGFEGHTVEQYETQEEQIVSDAGPLSLEEQILSGIPGSNRPSQSGSVSQSMQRGSSKQLSPSGSSKRSSKSGSVKRATASSGALLETAPPAPTVPEEVGEVANPDNEGVEALQEEAEELPTHTGEGLQDSFDGVSAGASRVSKDGVNQNFATSALEPEASAATEQANDVPQAAAPAYKTLYSPEQPSSPKGVRSRPPSQSSLPTVSAIEPAPRSRPASQTNFPANQLTNSAPRSRPPSQTNLIQNSTTDSAVRSRPPSQTNLPTTSALEAAPRSRPPSQTNLPRTSSAEAGVVSLPPAPPLLRTMMTRKGVCSQSPPSPPRAAAPNPPHHQAPSHKYGPLKVNHQCWRVWAVSRRWPGPCPATTPTPPTRRR